MATLTNLITNPSFETAVAGSTVVRTNLFTNPRISSLGGIGAYAGAGGGATLSRVLGVSGAGGDAVHYEWSTAATNLAGGVYPVFTFPFAAGVTYKGGVWARSKLDQVLRATLIYRNASNVTVGPTFAADPVSMKAGQWGYFQALGTAPTGATNAVLTIYVAAGGHIFEAGEWLEASNIILEQTDQLRPYFDGNTTNALGVVYEWTGAVSASTSTAKTSAVDVRRNQVIVTNPTDVMSWLTQGYGTGAVVVESTIATSSPSGANYSYRTTWTTAATGGGHERGVDAGSVVSGTTYTVSFWVRSNQAVNTACIRVAYGSQVVNSPDTVLTAGAWLRLSFTFTATETATLKVSARINVLAGTAAGFTFDCAEPLVEATSILGAFFDGASSGSGSLVPAWTGAVNNSASVQQATSVFGVAVSVPNSLAMYQGQGAGLGEGKSFAAYLNQAGNWAGRIYWNVNMVAGRTYTVTFTARSTGTETWTIAGRTGPTTGTGQNSFGALVTVPDTVMRYQRTMVAVGNTSLLAMVASSVVPGTLFEVDNLSVVEANYTGPYFDGDDIGAVWDGTPHASTSSRPAQVLTYWDGTVEQFVSVVGG